MNSNLQNMMSEAARLTQAGDLAGATALIQRALNGSARTTGSNGAAPAQAQPNDVIDVPARLVADSGGDGGKSGSGNGSAARGSADDVKSDAAASKRSDQPEAAARTGAAASGSSAAPQPDARMSAPSLFSGGANPLAAFMSSLDPQQAFAALNGSVGGNGGGDLLAQMMATLGGALPGIADDDASDGDETAVPDDTDAAAPQKADVAAQRDRFIAGGFGTRRLGRRAWKLYVPPQAATGRRLPLVVMLHGCTQDPDDFARGTAMNDAARAQGFYVLYPAQSQKMNPQRCWNWFKPNHQQRDRGEPALIAGMVRDICARYDDIDTSRVYVAGLSAGGAMAAILAAAYPDLFAAAGVHSGLAAGAASDLPSAFSAMQSGGAATVGAAAASVANGVPTIVFHSDADSTVNVKNAEQLLAASLGADEAASLVAEEVAATPGHPRGAARRVHHDATGAADAELWIVHGAPHGWSGGNAAGSFTDAAGPDASAEMLRFFWQHRLRKTN